jgi:hypothetical protein
MTEDDRGAFGRLLHGAAEALGETLTPVRLGLYFRLLADVPLAAVTEALDRHMRVSPWFPKPCELRPQLPDAAEAWAEVQAALTRGRRTDLSPLAFEAVKHLGGWFQFKLLTRTGQRIEFTQTYTSLRDRAHAEGLDAVLTPGAYLDGARAPRRGALVHLATVARDVTPREGTG